MFNLISVALEKLGNWFGIIFKIILPIVAMYRPIKTFALSVVMLGTYYDGNAASMNNLGLVLFGILYVVLFPTFTSIVFISASPLMFSYTI